MKEDYEIDEKLSKFRLFRYFRLFRNLSCSPSSRAASMIHLTCGERC